MEHFRSNRSSFSCYTVTRAPLKAVLLLPSVLNRREGSCNLIFTGSFFNRRLVLFAGCDVDIVAVYMQLDGSRRSAEDVHVELLRLTLSASLLSEAVLVDSFCEF